MRMSVFAAAGTVQVLPCVLLSSGIDSVQLVWLCSVCLAGNAFICLSCLASARVLAVVAAVSGCW